MGTPYLAEIKIMSFNFAPKGWAMCNGQILPINQNQALFALLGTTYGGNGTTTFALPNLQGKMPMYQGAGFVLGQTGGEQAHTVTINEMPNHNHPLQVFAPAAPGGSLSPAAAGSLYGTSLLKSYGPPTSLVQMSPKATGSTGGSQPHNNMQPYLVLTFCIALVGIFPSRS